jgi:hypothetical protein
MMVPAAALLTLVASVALLIARRLAALLAFARALLAFVKIAASPTAAPAAVVGAILIRRAFTPVFLLGFDLWCLGSGTAKKFLHPAKHATRLRRFLRRGCWRRSGLFPVAFRYPALRFSVRTLVAEISRAVLASFPVRAIIRTIPPAVFAVGTWSGGTVVVGTSGLGGGLARNVAERLAFPTLFNTAGRFRRKNLDLRFWRILGGIHGSVLAHRGYLSWQGWDLVARDVRQSLNRRRKCGRLLLGSNLGSGNDRLGSRCRRRCVCLGSRNFHR